MESQKKNSNLRKQVWKMNFSKFPKKKEKHNNKKPWLKTRTSFFRRGKSLVPDFPPFLDLGFAGGGVDLVGCLAPGFPSI